MEGVTTIVHKVTTRGLRFHQNSEVPQHLVVFFFFFNILRSFHILKLVWRRCCFFPFWNGNNLGQLYAAIC